MLMVKTVRAQSRSVPVPKFIVSRAEGAKITGFVRSIGKTWLYVIDFEKVLRTTDFAGFWIFELATLIAVEYRFS